MRERSYLAAMDVRLDLERSEVRELELALDAQLYELRVELARAEIRDFKAELRERPVEELSDELLARMLPQARTEDDVALVAVRLRPATGGETPGGHAA